MAPVSPLVICFLLNRTNSVIIDWLVSRDYYIVFKQEQNQGLIGLQVIFHDGTKTLIYAGSRRSFLQ